MKEDIAIELAKIDYVAWPENPAANVVPMKLELEPDEGFTFTNYRFHKPYVQKFGDQQQHLIRVVDGYEPIQFSHFVSATVLLWENMCLRECLLLKRSRIMEQQRYRVR